ncbi:hypothetical protein [Aestuariispira insulae]|uniref:hypothetical protein n=1 Tax=Aestuariispira insulae TaxID=1461337 RepID=UPI000E2234DF|nr:hypothetical protein [Aestuariispira insulae]
MAKKQDFADRGVYVGFRGRGLEAVRCRKAKTENDVYEALIVNWSGDNSRSGDMIMPFMGLKDWRTLNFFDETLFLAVQDYGKVTQGYMDPLVMRNLRLKIVADHGDEFEVSQAQAAMEVEERDTRETFLEVLALFSRDYGARAGDEQLRHVTRKILMRLMSEDPDTVYKLARELATIMGRLSGASGDVLARRIEFYSEFAAPICSLVSGDNSRDIGYLSRQLGELEKLADEIKDYAGLKRGELSTFANKIYENAQKFVDYALIKAQDIQALILDNTAYIDPVKFKAMQKELKENRLYISFALDGWGGHSIRWAKAKLEGADACNDVIVDMYRAMPQPTKELEEVSLRGYDTKGAGLRTGSVREMHSWDSEERDDELYNRVLQGKLQSTDDPEAKKHREKERQKARDESKALLDDVLNLVAGGTPAKKP